MRILMVLDHPYPSDIRVENEARSLVAAGHSVGLLQISPDDRPARDWHEGTRLFRHRLNGRLVNWLRGTAGMLPIIDHYLDRLIRQIYKEWQFDAIHVHDLYLVGAGLKAARSLRLPLVADLHENWVEALQHYAWSTRLPGRLVVNIERWERMEKRWVTSADRLIVPIEEAKNRYEGLGVEPSRIGVVPNTVDLDSFRAYPIRQEIVDRLRTPLSLVYTGHVDAHRGLSTVIMAMPAILDAVPGARLFIVGSGATLDEHKKESSQAGVSESVTFVGRVRQDEVRSYIAGADISLIPHIKTPHTDNTIPHKLFHAMLERVPVVVSNCDPLERIVNAVNCGVVFKSEDSASLVAAVLGLTESSGRDEMGRRGHAAVLRDFNWDATVGPLLATYEQLV